MHQGRSDHLQTYASKAAAPCGPYIDTDAARTTQWLVLGDTQN